jgi:hypothetical protein
VDRAVEMYHQNGIHKDQIMRKERGDTIMHITAETGNIRMFEAFYSLGNSLTILNKVRKFQNTFRLESYLYTWQQERDLLISSSTILKCRKMEKSI